MNPTNLRSNLLTMTIPLSSTSPENTLHLSNNEPPPLTAIFSNGESLFDRTKRLNDAFLKRNQKLYPYVEDLSKLPRAWSNESKASPIGLTRDNLGCYYRGYDDDKAAAVRANNYIPPSCLLYYFEITITSSVNKISTGIGLASSQVMLTKLPGWVHESYGYHADDGKTFHSEGVGKSYGPTATSNDVIGCGYNLIEGKVFFTKNGLNLGKAFEDVPGNILYYPIVGLSSPGNEIRVNFGQEDFVYDIQQDLRCIKKNMTMTIASYPISDFKDWQNTLYKLVQSWLVQNSYPKTAESFTRAAKIECKENIQRIEQRYRIQQLVLSGKISEAISHTNRLYPSLFENNPNLLFALKCRQFVELIGGAEQDYQFNFSTFINLGADKDDHHSRNEWTIGPVPALDINGSDRVDQTNADGHQAKKNGCNGNTGGSNNGSCSSQRVRSHVTIPQSSISSQEMMDVDQPVTNSNENTNRIDPRDSVSTSQKNNSNDKSVGTSNIGRNCSDSPHVLNKIDLNTSDGRTIRPINVDEDLDKHESKYASLLEFANDLNEFSHRLDKLYGKNEANEKMLLDSIELIAYTSPRDHSVGKLLLDPKEREQICQLLNSSIIKDELGDIRAPIEEVVNHLRKLVRLNDSQGRWLLDQLY